MKMDELFFNEKLNNKNMVEKNYVGWFWKNQHMKCSIYTSNRTSYLFNMEYIKFCNIWTT
jgi:hypothetical protein